MQMEEETKETHVGSFAKIACGDCGHEQIVFSRAATKVTCLVCGSLLAEPGGGLATFLGELKEYID